VTKRFVLALASAAVLAGSLVLPAGTASAKGCWGTLGKIPVIGTVCVRQGTSSAILAIGAGHFERSHPSWMAAHDVTPVGGRPYGPFHDLNQLKVGSTITFNGNPYKVIVSKPIAASAVSGFIAKYGYYDLALTTCWPRYHMWQRWTVIAKPA
jgi:sortase (surface protein transpeptidase)